MGGIEYPEPTDIRQYAQLASWLRVEIISGRIALGAKLPGEQALRKSFGVDRSVVRRAVQLLREEGVIVTRHGVGSFVATVPRLQIAVVRPGDRVSARMPDDAERALLGQLSPGIPLLIITRVGGDGPELYSAAVTVVHVEG
jgi:DNA-binding transcriptional MocR family regulator